MCSALCNGGEEEASYKDSRGRLIMTLIGVDLREDDGNHKHHDHYGQRHHDTFVHADPAVSGEMIV